jgi:hypothetical protein
VLRIQIGLQLWKIWRLRWILIVLWKLLERIPTFQPKRVWVITQKPWFDEGSSKLSDQRKQSKLQWLQDPREINGANPNNLRREASRHFRIKKREYVKDKINELALNSKNKKIRDLYRGINEFKWATNLEVT